MSIEILRTGKISPRALGISTLMVAGLFMLAWVGFQNTDPSKSFPYTRVLVKEGGPAKFPDLGLDDKTGIVIRKYEIRTEGIDRALAEFHVAQNGNASPIPLTWESKLAEPVLIANIEPEAPKKVAEIIAKHLPDNATVLGWWDISRLLKLYEDISVEFADVTAGPVFVPGVWANQAQEIRENVREFWQKRDISASVSLDKKFDAFTDALIMEAQAGSEALQKIAGGKPTFLVLNMLDAYSVGAKYPERFGVGFKDFPRTKQAHGLIKGVKEWMKENGYTAYSVYPLDKTVIRVFFLTDEVSKNSLLAKLLPFDSSKPGQVPGTKLVYQHRGYWIYELTGTDNAN